MGIIDWRGDRYDKEICRAKILRIISEVEFFTCEVGAGQFMCPVVPSSQLVISAGANVKRDDAVTETCECRCNRQPDIAESYDSDLSIERHANRSLKQKASAVPTS